MDYNKQTSLLLRALRILVFSMLVIPLWVNNAAALDIISFYPANFSLGFEATDSIRVVFDAIIDDGSVDSTSFLVRGKTSGVYRGTYRVSADTAWFIPRWPSTFIWGDMITVTVTEDVRTPINDFLDRSVTWQFWVRPSGGARGATERWFDLNSFDPGKLIEVVDLGPDADSILHQPDLVSIGPKLGGDRVSYWLNEFSSDPDIPYRNPRAGFFDLDNQHSTDIEPGDFNNDGRMDLIVANEESDYFYFIKNTGGSIPQFDSVYYDIGGIHFNRFTTLDYDGDGYLDLAGISPGQNILAVFHNVPSGSERDFIVDWADSTSEFWPSDLISADFNNDRLMDIAVCARNDDGESIYIYINTGGLPGNPFISAVIQTGPNSITGVEAVNADGNQSPDLLLYSSLTTNWRAAVINNPMGPSTSIDTLQGIEPGIHGYPVDAKAADIEFSGGINLEYAVITEQNYLFQYISGYDNPIIIGPVVGMTLEESPPKLSLADLDYDGDIDILVSYESGNTIVGWRNPDTLENLVVVPDTVNFGIVEINTVDTLTYSIINAGNEIATLDDIYGDDLPFNVIDFQAGDTLAPGESSDITAVFQPPAYAIFEDTVVHVIGLRSLYRFEENVIYYGIGGKRSFGLDSDTIDFGVQCRDTVFQQLRIENSSPENNMELVIDSYRWNPAGQDRFRVRGVSLPDTIQAGEAITYFVDFFADSIFASYSAWLVFEHNATGTAGIDSVYMTGTVFCNIPPEADTVLFTISECSDTALYISSENYRDPDNLPQNLSIISVVGYPSWVSWDGDTTLIANPGPEVQVDEDTEYWFPYVITDGADTASSWIGLTLLDVENEPPEVGPQLFSILGDSTQNLSLEISDNDGGCLGFPDIATTYTNRSLQLLGVLQNYDTLIIVHPDQVPEGDVLVCSLMVSAFDGFDSSYTVIPVNILHNPNIKPDLRLIGLSAASQRVPVRDSVALTVITDVIQNSFPEEYVIELRDNDTLFAEISMPPLGKDEADTVTVRRLISSLGNHTINARAVIPQGAADRDTTNNERSIIVVGTEGDVIVKPKPFTPNGDGFNDRLIFDLTALYIDEPQVLIYSLAGVKLKKLDDVSADKLIYWDGKDDSGLDLPPGAYMFIVTDGSRKLHSGVISLAR
ncbi:MAG: hypothetical protein GF307_02275 [candidate division Zixibacteria bacterium]|nr:hypothetical protein [candidate division Zixibacteria bacterium]